MFAPYLSINARCTLIPSFRTINSPYHIASLISVKLKEIPSELWLSFFSLPHLTAMHLGCNQLSHLQCSAVNVESHIEYLDLSDNRLVSFTPSIIDSCIH